MTNPSSNYLVRIKTLRKVRVVAVVLLIAGADDGRAGGDDLLGDDEVIGPGVAAVLGEVGRSRLEAHHRPNLWYT